MTEGISDLQTSIEEGASKLKTSAKKAWQDGKKAISEVEDSIDAGVKAIKDRKQDKQE